MSIFAFALLIGLFGNSGRASQPRALNYEAVVGPDGPWNALIQQYSFPEKNITLLPSLTKSSLFVQEDACKDPESACPQGEPRLWAQEPVGQWSWMNSTTFAPAIWDDSIEPLNLTGDLSYISDRLVFMTPGQDNAYLDFAATTIDRNVEVNFPSTTTYYTLNVGFLSLYGAEEHVTYRSVNDSDISLNTTLPMAYKQDAIPSLFYGLHVGSASAAVPIPGSLVLGGYDKSRCLTDPIVSNTDTFNLVDIGIGVTGGGSPLAKDSSLPVKNLLKHNGSGSLRAFPNPGVPYLHLPGDTCAAIAEHLPVLFDETLGLYLWNTSSPSYNRVITSPSYLYFEFDTSPNLNTIYLPFALLNLTLEWPLVQSPTQYFPCSPYSPSDGSTFHLGRAFLQGVLLAQDWKAKKKMLAQAPGPDFGSESVVAISPNNTSMVRLTNAPAWNNTWGSRLKELEGDTFSNSDKAGSSGTLSTGTIVGIVIAIVAGLLIATVVCWRIYIKRSRARAHFTGNERTDIERHDDMNGGYSGSPVPVEAWAPGKHGLTLSPIEMDTNGVYEMSSDLRKTQRAEDTRNQVFRL